ncbi:hypothetical protein RRF57_006512 [Xylaria bambusicola]|uniref:magnesium chelatase n=1 Tax=Xylaria bambusicola TaxID=326684 RepID=A0AAN7Z5M2_9PEZI
MADEDLVNKIRELGDVDLAVLLCLISREHCIVSTDAEYLDDLTVELQLVASRTFGLDSVVVDCTPEITLDDLVAALQLPQPQSQPIPTPGLSPLHARNSEAYFNAYHSGGSVGLGKHLQQHHHGSLRPSSGSRSTAAVSPSRVSLPSAATQQPQIANIVLARNLDCAPKAVQIQCLELMRTRRIFTRTAVQACPKQFLLIAVLGSESAGQARLTKHLNDHFYISHWQDPEDGFAHMEEEEEEGDKGEEYQTFDEDNNRGAPENADRDKDDDTASQASAESVVRRTRGSKTPSTPTMSIGPESGQQQTVATDWAIPTQGVSHTVDNKNRSNKNNYTSSGSGNPIYKPVFTETDISTLSSLSLQAHVDIEVQRYQMNIIAFLRMHRAVAPGSVPPTATTHFRTLIRALATLHGLEFVTPELVQLAARKIYAHRIVIVPPDRERSMQWGSDLSAVKALLEGVRPEDVVEDVLGIVDVPL